QRSVREPKSKWKLRKIRFIEIARNEFLVVAIGKRSCIVLNRGTASVERVVVNGNLSDTARPRHRKLSCRTCFAKQCADKSWPSLNSREPRSKNRRNMLGSPRKNQWPAAEDDQNDRFSCCGNGFQQLFLSARKI